MKKLSVVLFITVVFIAGCANSAPDASINKDIQTNIFGAVESSGVQALINKGVTVIDVRTPEEYSAGHLENAVNIDFKAASFKEEISKLDKEKPYLVYCRTGGRSGQSVKIMEELGFKNIYDLKGGITAWQAEGKTVVK
jgi:rhodanese-related sulfurtransferase